MCQFAFQPPIQRQIDNRHESRCRRELHGPLSQPCQSHIFAVFSCGSRALTNENKSIAEVRRAQFNGRHGSYPSTQTNIHCPLNDRQSFCQCVKCSPFSGRRHGDAGVVDLANVWFNHFCVDDGWCVRCEKGPKICLVRATRCSGRLSRCCGSLLSVQPTSPKQRLSV